MSAKKLVKIKVNNRFCFEINPDNEIYLVEKIDKDLETEHYIRTSDLRPLTDAFTQLCTLAKV